MFVIVVSSLVFYFRFVGGLFPALKSQKRIGFKNEPMGKFYLIFSFFTKLAGTKIIDWTTKIGSVRFNGKYFWEKSKGTVKEL